MSERQEPFAKMLDDKAAATGGAKNSAADGGQTPNLMPVAGKLRAARGIALAVSASAIVWLLIYAVTLDR